MSDCLINIRAWDWHLQLKRSGKVSVSRNAYHRDNGWPNGFFSIYEFWPFK